MTNTSPDRILIDSNYDNYSIEIGAMTKDLYLKEKGSMVEFQFNQEPSNLYFNITEENETKLAPSN